MRTPRRLAHDATVVVLDLVLIGLAIALAPFPLTAFIIVLSAERGARKGAVFVLGWLASMAVVVAATVAATGGNPPKPKTSPSTASLAVKIALGVFLLCYASWREWRRRPPTPPKKTPKWQARVDSMSPWFALGLAAALQPWALIGAGAATVVGAKLSSPVTYVTLFLYCVLASSTYVAIQIYGVARREQSQALLTRLRVWINDHTDQVLIVGSLILGLWLIGKNIYLIV